MEQNQSCHSTLLVKRPFLLLLFLHRLLHLLEQCGLHNIERRTKSLHRSRMHVDIKHSGAKHTTRAAKHQQKAFCTLGMHSFDRLLNQFSDFQQLAEPLGSPCHSLWALGSQMGGPMPGTHGHQSRSCSNHYTLYSLLLLTTVLLNSTVYHISGLLRP